MGFHGPQSYLYWRNYHGSKHFLKHRRHRWQSSHSQHQGEDPGIDKLLDDCKFLLLLLPPPLPPPPPPPPPPPLPPLFKKISPPRPPPPREFQSPRPLPRPPPPLATLPPKLWPMPGAIECWDDPPSRDPRKGLPASDNPLLNEGAPTVKAAAISDDRAARATGEELFEMDPAACELCGYGPKAFQPRERCHRRARRLRPGRPWTRAADALSPRNRTR